MVGIDWAWLAADGTMGKAPLGGAKTGPNPTDRAKRGRNVRFCARREAVPIGLAHDGANRLDVKLLAATLDSIPCREPTRGRPQRSCLDRGYDYASAREVVGCRDYSPHIRTRGEELRLKARVPGWKARRWGRRTHKRHDSTAASASAPNPQ